MALRFLNSGYFAGKVGIGIEVPVAKLQVAGTTTYNSDTVQALRVCDATDTSKGIHIGFDNTLGKGIIQAGDFGVQYKDLLLNPNTGNIGIGTTSPDAKLDIESATNPTIRLTNSTNALGAASVGTLEFFTKDSSTGASRVLSSIVCINEADSPSVPDGQLVFKTSLGGANAQPATEKMRIDPSGNVGIGSASPSAKLDVEAGATGASIGDTSTAAIFRAGRQNVFFQDIRTAAGSDWNNATFKIIAKIDSTSHQSIDFVNDLYFQEHIDILTGNQVFNTRFNANGNVGIGTNTPVSKLEVAGSIKASGITANIGSDPGVSLSYNATAGINYINTWASSPLVTSTYNYQAFETEGVERIRILGGSGSTAGNVGIGTTLPSEKLVVAGNIIADNIFATSKIINGDTSNANPNLLTQLGIKIANQNDVYGNTARVVISQYEATYTQDGTAGGGVIRLLPESTMTPGDTFTFSIYYKDLVGFLTMDIVDTAVTGPRISATGTAAAPKSGRIYGTAVKPTTAPQNGYNFVDINFSTSTVVTLLNPKLETGKFPTEFVATTEEESVPQTLTTNDIIATGNVGIGTTSPAAGLQVARGSTTIPAAGASTASAVFGNSTSDDNYGVAIGANSSGVGYISAQRTDGTATTYNLAVQPNGGDVGIGTATPGAKLHVDGTAIFDTDTGSQPFYITRSGNANQSLKIYTDDVASYFTTIQDETTGTYGSMIFILDDGAPSPVYSFQYGSSSILRLQADGKVGIGTTNPQVKLQVDGSIRALGTTSTTGQIDASPEFGAFRFFNGSTFRGGLGTGQWASNTGANNTDIVQYLNNVNYYISNTSTPLLKVATNGNVGIGTGTSSATQKLQVNGRIYIEQQGTNWNETTPGLGIGALHFDPVGDGADNTGNAITFGASDASSGTTANAGIYTRSDGSFGTKMYFATTDSYATGSKTRMTIRSDGNVGIGTAGPASKLDVQGEGRFKDKLLISGVDFDYASLESTAGHIISRVDTQDGLFDYGNSALNINSGNVGIPGGELDVYGTIKSTTNGNRSKGNINIGLTTNNSTKWSSITGTQYAHDTEGEGFSIINGLGTSTYNAVYIGGALNEQNAATEISFYTAADTVTRTGSIKMRIIANGNVGIGETTPDAKLEVGALGLGNSTGNQINQVIFQGDRHDWIFKQIRTGNTTDWNSTTLRLQNRIDNTDLQSIDFVTDSSFYRHVDINTNANTFNTRFTHTGRVGIGNNNPDEKLEISGSSATTYPKIKISNPSQTGRYMSIGMIDSINHCIEANGGSTYLTFKTSGTQKMVIESGGNVGIGVTNPSNQLHVHTDTDNTYAIRIEGSTNNGANVWTGLGIGGEANNTKSALLFQDIGVSYARGKLHLCVNNELNQNNATPADAKLTVSNDGNVGIGDTTPGYKLDVNGTIRATGDVIAFSDARVKDNVVTIDNALDKVNRLRGVTYTRNDTEDKQTKMGVIAQEVLEVIPEVVQQDDKGNYSVAYGNMNGLLIEAIKELKAEIEELKSRL